MRTAPPTPLPEAGARSRGTPTTPHRQRGRRFDATVVAVATAVGLWLGVAAPSASPVTPPTPTATTLAPQLPTPVGQR